jgi:hypothetical protein
MKQQGTGKSLQVTLHFANVSESYIQSVSSLHNIPHTYKVSGVLYKKEYI